MLNAKSIPFPLRAVRTRKIQALLLVLLLAIAVSLTNRAASTAGSLKTTAVKTAHVNVDGPGALYIGRLDSEIGLWVLSDVTARLVDKVSIADGADQPLLIEIVLGKNLAGVFYSSDLPLGDALRLKFEGAVNNKKCPGCTVVMPLAGDALSKAFAKVNEEEKVSGREELELLLAQQNQIYETAGKITEQLASSEGAYINQQKNDLRDIYEQMKGATDQGELLLNKSQTDAMAFATQVNQQSTHDVAAVKSASDVYANFLMSQTPKIQSTTNCVNLENWWRLEKQLERDLRIDGYPDPLPETPDEDSYQPANREVIIKQYEDANFPKLQNQLRPCTLNLLGGLYSETEDISFPGSTPDLSKENLVLEAPYETIGITMSDFVDRVDKDATAFETSQETKFGALDKLAYYQEFEKAMESLPKPLLKYAGEAWLKDEPTAAEMSLQKKGAGGSASTSNLKTTGAPKSKLSIPTILSKCGNDPVVTFHIAGVSILIGTPFNDEVTGDNDKNLIITLRGDDCVDAKDEMDAVFAMNGADTIYGGKGHGFLLGGKGDDVITGGKGESYKVTIGAVVLTFDIGSFISGDAGSDTIYGSENSLLDLHGYTDVIMGDGLANAANSGDDVIDGMKGINLIFGQAKNDNLKTTGYGRVGVDGVPMLFGSLFWGGQGDDTVTGTATPPMSQSLGDLIFGGPDNDTVSAGNGRDFVFGNKGSDNLNGNGQDDFLFGGPEPDVVHGDGGRDIMTGGSGDDTLFSDAGVFSLMLGNSEADKLNGGLGVDVGLGNSGPDELFGQDGPIDILAGMQGADTIDGGNGLDGILGGSENDKIDAGAGLDLVFAGGGWDHVKGGAGPDVIFGQSNLQNDNPKQLCLNFSGDVEQLYGDGGIDIIFGQSGCDAIYGGPGPNLLFGGSASDRIEGGDDSDIAFGGIGNDTIIANDGIDVAFGGPDDDAIQGLANIDLLVGGEGNDHIWGGDGADILIGFKGGDTLEGENGPNLLIGGDGKDTLKGGNSIDIAFAGNDEDNVNGGDGFNFSFGGDQKDTLTGGNGSDVILGGDGDDSISGGDGSNLLFGESGNESAINGGSGLDIIFAGPGDDNADGGDGNNLILGNAGQDNIAAALGRNLAFGGNDNDTIKGGCNSESPRDYIFGNGGGSGNYLEGNKVNDRDILVSGTKTRC